jgi:hypothetical protein
MRPLTSEQRIFTIEIMISAAFNHLESSLEDTD